MQDLTRRIREVFREALSQSSVSEQDRLVQQRCEDDPALYHVVQDLLRADRECDERGFLEWKKTAPAEAVEPDANVGRQLGSYRLLELVGGGATGLVYRAERADGVRQQVAVKLLRIAHHDPSGLKRFQIEKQALADISHPGIVRLITHGVADDGTAFLVMDWIDGERIDHRIERTKPSIRTRVEWMVSIARTLSAAHASGILHRDLKPANILITSDDRVVITDFGLAKFVGDARPEMTDLTVTGGLLGTPGYMAPEQLDPRGTQVTAAADVYGLGAVLFYLLTQRPPLRGDSAAEIIAAHMRLQVPSPSSFEPSVDRDLETICLKCLESAPEKRYASASAVVDDLQRYLAGAPIAARPVTGIEKGIRWANHNRLPAALIASTATLLIVVFVSLAGLLVVRSRQTRQLEAQQQHLFDILDSYYTETSKWLSRHPQTESIREPLLERARELYEQVLSLNPTNRRGRVANATASYRLAKIAALLQDPPACRAAALEAQQKFEALARDYPDEPQYRFDIFHCQFLQPDLEAAHQSISELLETHDDPYFRDAFVASARRLGDVAQNAEEAERYRQQAYEIAAELAEEFPGIPFFRRHYDQMTLGWRRHALTHEELLAHSQAALSAADLSVELEGNISNWCRVYLQLANTGILSALVLERTEDAFAIRARLLSMLTTAREHAPHSTRPWIALGTARAEIAMHQLYRSDHDRQASEALALRELDAALLLWPEEPQLKALQLLFEVQFRDAPQPDADELRLVVEALRGRAYFLAPLLIRAGLLDEAETVLTGAELPHWQVYQALISAHQGGGEESAAQLAELEPYAGLKCYQLVQDEILRLRESE
ncbi:MAG: serine/threonine-protein kinase [Planctomycetota bacterium]